MDKGELGDSGEINVLNDLKSGSRASFEIIYRQYSPKIYLNILRMIKSEEDAEEILQDVFIKVWEKRDLIDPAQSFKSYLFQISRFTVYNFIRKVNLDKKLTSYLARENTELYSHIEESIAYKESDKFILDAIEKLPPQRMLVYKLCKIEGKSYAEVSAFLGISTSTINDHIVKATKFLKDRHSSLDSVIALALVSILFRDL